MPKRLARPRQGLNAHRLVANVAVEMANELFEVYARENAIYRRMRAGGEVTEKQARLVFVERVAPRLLEDARQTLTTMLTLDDTAQCVKDEIYEALLKDSDLRANRPVAESAAIIPPSVH